MPPSVPIHHYPGPISTTKQDQSLLPYSMLMYSRLNARFKHSNLFKVIPPTPQGAGSKDKPPNNSQCRRLADNASTPTTSFLTATALIYAIGAGITAAAGTRLALQSVLVESSTLLSFQLDSHKENPSLLFVTTSACRDWVICAPAAFLGSGRHFSGALSGIEPSFAVTRQPHGRPRSYHRKVIGQTSQ